MKRIITQIILLTSTIWSKAQQVNPVPDYVFRNQMSVGRGTVTDTAAYFSIGPRYGATRGMMPPMVVDTASFSANKRNGLLIFSVQKNKFLYWDSVGVKWAEMAGTGGTAISSGDTAAMLLPYVRHAGYGLTKSGQSFLVDTLNIATRAWRQKGLDSLAALEVSGSGTTNYVPKFTASSTIGNSNIFDDGSGVGIYKTPNKWFASRKPLEITSAGTIAGVAGAGLGFLEIWGNSYLDTNVTSRYIISGSAARYSLGNNASGGSSHTFFTAPSGTAGGTASFTAALNIFSNSRVAVNATLDAGYQFDVNGTMRSVNGANFATTSGSVGIGTTTPSEKLHVLGNILATEAAGTYPRFISTVGSKSWEIGYRSFTTNYELREDGTTRLVVANGGSVGVNTGTPNASAVLDVTSTTQGFLPPRMTTAQRDAISSPAAGLVIYNTTTSKLQVYTTAWTDLH